MPEFYEMTIKFLDQIVSQKKWEFLYLDWELQLLTSIGYGLDLNKCVASGSTENLFYISPKQEKRLVKKKVLNMIKNYYGFLVY